MHICNTVKQRINGLTKSEQIRASGLELKFIEIHPIVLVPRNFVMSLYSIQLKQKEIC